MKKALTITLALLLLSGCGEDPAKSNSTPRRDIEEIEYKLRDGRTVTCLLWDVGGAHDTGISCDWMSAIAKDDS